MKRFTNAITPPFHAIRMQPVPAAPALTTLPTASTSLRRPPSRDTGIKVVAALMVLVSLTLAVAFWQDQQSVPRRLHDAAVSAHARALFEHVQDELQMADRLLRALDMGSSLQDSNDVDTFLRLAKSISPGLQDLQTLALAEVSTHDDGSQRTQLLRIGDMLDEPQDPHTGPGERTDDRATDWSALATNLPRIAESAARQAHTSGRLTLAGPLMASNTRVLAIAQANRQGGTHVALIDLDKWLDSLQNPHAKWVTIALQVSADAVTAAPASARTESPLPADASAMQFDFENISPQVQLVVTPLSMAPAAPPTIVGACGIALSGFMIAALILLLGRRGNEATATAHMVGRALTASDQRLQRALQLTQDGIWEYDLARRKLYISGQTRVLIGWKPETSPTPAALLRMLPPKWRREVLRVIVDAAGQTATRELNFPLSDAMMTARWMRLRVRGMSNDFGKPWLITGSLADISEEISHVSAQDRYRALLMRVLDAMPIPVALKTADHQVVMLNERYAKQLMSTLEPTMKRAGDSNLVDAGFAGRMEELDQLAIATGEPQVAHEWLRTSEGAEVYLRITRVLCDGLNGEPMVLGTYEDLTEMQGQAQQQTALREYFERVFDLLPSPTYIKDANHRYILTNQAHARANKTTKEFMIGKRSADFSPDEAAEIEAAERHILSTASDEIYEKEYYLASGNMQRNTIIRKVRITDPAGNPVLLGTSTNMTVVREAEEDLRRQAAQQSRLRKFLQDVFDAVPHPLFVKDRQSRYIMTNHAHAESVGARMEEIIGKRASDFISEDVARRIQQSEEDLFTGASTASTESEYVLTHRSGETRHTIIRKALCTNADGDPVLVGVNTDITRLRDAEGGLRRHRDRLSELVREQTIDLVRAKEVAERANETKSVFLANMSHELRTPLHAILSFARLGESRGERLGVEKLHDYFNRIRVSGDRLLAMLNDLLDLSKLESGRIMLDIRPTQIEGIVQESMHEFEAWLTARRLRLSAVVEAGLPRIMVDAPKIGQVLRNLLSNAIKFSPEGSDITLSMHICDMRARDALVPAVEICIADQGSGIPSAELESIFEKFVQSSSNSRDMGGTGLGLAICREIVTAHGGEVFARNGQTGGAEFVLRLRVDRRASRAQATRQMDAEGIAPADTAGRTDSETEMQPETRAEP